MMKILLVGGGTSGHVLPALSIAREILKKDPKAQLLYVGSLKGTDRALVTEAGIKFIGVPAGKWRRYFDLRNLIDIVVTLVGFITALFVVIFFWPDRVLIKGGYVGVPVGLAAWILGRKLILHESDAVMGVANRVLAPLARKICVSFPLEAYENNKRLLRKLVFTGVPVNSMFYDKTIGQIDLSLNDKKPVILVTGGSQGAHAINQLIQGSLPQLLSEYQVVHQTGTADYAAAQSLKASSDLGRDYYPIDLVPNTQMSSLMKRAAVIISRAGATAAFEIAAVARPAILIPLPGSANNHQYANAKYLSDKGAAALLLQSEATPAVLAERIERVVRSDMGKRLAFNIRELANLAAAEQIATEILK
jgi:UDP-N-acetylglucosamine--N-acetylmuramyl-(pentapeptide) pyrophosphoryl-undecaprenol N-acetylglucosamine transferase